MLRSVIRPAATIAALAFAAVDAHVENLTGGEVVRSHSAALAWRSASSDNFDIYGSAPETELRDRALRLERLRRDLYEKWLGQIASSDWAPRCAVVLHSSAESYFKAVPGGGSTAGSSLFETDGRTVAVRRIDVRPAPIEALRGTLAHELVHQILGERFPSRLAPAWAEEGIAVLEDSAECRRLHRANLHDAMRRHGALPLHRLLGVGPALPAGAERLFYAQSASLTEFLVARATPKEFVLFIEQVIEQGYDSALREVYGFARLADLQEEWLKHLLSEPSTGGSLIAKRGPIWPVQRWRPRVQIAPSQKNH